MHSGIERTLFLLSASARAYACQEVPPGCRMVVMDGYADSDLQADEVVRVDLQEGQFTEAIVEEVAVRSQPGDILIYGSGFEQQPHLLKSLSRHVDVLGNSPHTLSLCADPLRLHRYLKRLGICSPDTQEQRPDSDAGWLYKASGCSGGAHVRSGEDSTRVGSEGYWQRQIDGDTYSLLFFAASENIRMIGVNRLLKSDVRTQPYIWIGALAPVRLEESVWQQVEWSAKLLSTDLKLLGICGFDFIVDRKNSVYIIDINPRLTATFGLHQERVPDGLLQMQLQICESGSLEGVDLKEPEENRMRGMRIVYAPDALHIPETMNWPAECTDLPHPGEAVGQGEPICTVHGDYPSESLAESGLHQQTHAVLQELQAQGCGVQLTP